MFCRNVCVSKTFKLSINQNRFLTTFGYQRKRHVLNLSTLNVNYKCTVNRNGWQTASMRHFSVESIAEIHKPKSPVDFQFQDNETMSNTENMNETTTQSLENFDFKSFVGDAGNSIADLPLPLETASTVVTESLNFWPWFPPDCVYHVVSYFHGSLPWWASIVSATVALRFLTFPLVVKIQRNASTMVESTDEMREIQKKFMEAMQSRNQEKAIYYSQKLNKVTRETMGKQMKFMWKPMLNGGVFASFFIALREMANHPIVSMKTGGLYWFTDLTVPDPYYILPLITSSTLYVVLKSGIEFGMSSDNMKDPMMAKAFNAITYIMPPLAFVCMMNFSSALCVYWCTNNFISLIQATAFRQEKVRQILGLPKIEPVKSIASTVADKKISFKEGFDRAAFIQTIKERKALQEKLSPIKERK